MRFVLLVACGVLALAVQAAAQSHEPAAPPAKAAQAESRTATPPGAAAAHAPPVAGATGEKPARPAPVVSRVSALPKAVAAGHDAYAADHAPAAEATRKGGYVATGARKGEAGGAHGSRGKSKPVVSGAEALVSRTPAADAHGVAPADTHEAIAPAAASNAPASREPVKLSDVHGRLAAALAAAGDELRSSKDGATVEQAGERGPTPAGSAGSAASRTTKVPRFTVQWPAPRWTVRWPALGRVAVTWPSLTPAPAALPTRPLPD
jgi:hypothetical protein